MAKYVLTNKANEDLNKIWNYTFDKWSEEQADKYYQTLLDSCQFLSVNPNLGKNYSEIIYGLFGLKFKHHIIFYRKIHKETIEITRILHEHMDLKNRLID